MHPPSRARRIIKWTGAVFCILILLSYLRSAGYFISWTSHDRHWHVCLQTGVILLLNDIAPSPMSNLPGWNRGHVNGGGFIRWGFELVQFPDVRWVRIPLWFIFLVGAIPTAWLWHRDRRWIRPGCCLRCGYDLTGNTSGVCSECGLAKPPPATV